MVEKERKNYAQRRGLRKGMGYMVEILYASAMHASATLDDGTSVV